MNDEVGATIQSPSGQVIQIELVSCCPQPFAALEAQCGAAAVPRLAARGAHTGGPSSVLSKACEPHLQPGPQPRHWHAGALGRCNLTEMHVKEK